MTQCLSPSCCPTDCHQSIGCTHRHTLFKFGSANTHTCNAVYSLHLCNACDCASCLPVCHSNATLLAVGDRHHTLLRFSIAQSVMSLGFRILNPARTCAPSLLPLVITKHVPVSKNSANMQRPSLLTLTYGTRSAHTSAITESDSVKHSHCSFLHDQLSVWGFRIWT